MHIFLLLMWILEKKNICMDASLIYSLLHFFPDGGVTHKGRNAENFKMRIILVILFDYENKILCLS